MNEHERILGLQKALNQALIGGNHLASNLVGLLGPDFHLFQSRELLLKFLQRPYSNLSQNQQINIYEQWCCWKALIEARTMAEQTLQDYDGEIIPSLKP